MHVLHVNRRTAAASRGMVRARSGRQQHRSHLTKKYGYRQLLVPVCKDSHSAARTSPQTLLLTARKPHLPAQRPPSPGVRACDDACHSRLHILACPADCGETTVFLARDCWFRSGFSSQSLARRWSPAGRHGFCEHPAAEATACGPNDDSGGPHPR
jgi:hypothetical protein